MWKAIGDQGVVGVAGPLSIIISASQRRKGTWDAKVEIRGAIPSCVLWDETRFENIKEAQSAAVLAAKDVLNMALNLLTDMIPQ